MSEHAAPSKLLRCSTLALSLAAFASGCGGGHKLGGADAAVGTAGTTGAAGNTNTGADAGPLEPDAALVGALPDFADGTRLKALAYATDDGHALLHAWRDTQRQETCTFQVATDGKLRCLPAFEWTVSFADDKCTAPLLFRNACSGPLPAYAGLGYFDGCTTKQAPPLYKLTQKVATVAKFYSRDEAGACTGNVGPPPGAELWVAAATPEAPAAFVAAREILDGRGPSLMARYDQAEDGALQLLGAYDRAGQRRCAELPSLPGTCAPDVPEISGQREYADAACSVRTAIVAGACGAPVAADLVVQTTPVADACSPPAVLARFYRVGAPYPDRPFLKNGSACEQSVGPKVFPPSDARHVLGDEVPASAFPAVRTVDEGATRFKVRTLETPDGQHLLPKQLYDADNGGTCTPTLVGGTLRCLPDAQLDTFYFADAACTERLYVRSGSCTPKFLTLREASSCPGLNGTKPPRYFEIGPVVTPAAVFAGIGDTCIDFPVPTGIRTVIEHPLADAPAIAGE